MEYKEGQTLTHSDGRQVTLRNNQWVPAESQAPQDFSTLEMIKNIPSSAGQFISDITQPIRHPIDTAENLAKVITGGASKLAKFSREQGFPLVPEPSQEQLAKYGGYPQEATAEAVGDFFKQRYGSGEAFKQTAMKDPVGLMSDIAVLATGGAALPAKMPGLMGKAGKIVQTTGKALEPLNMMKGMTKLGLSQLPKTLPVSLYKSAVKFPTTLDVKYGMGTRTKLAETALKHKIMPTEKGILKLAGYEKDLGIKIGSLIDEATASGKAIPKSKVFKYLKDARRETGGVKVGARTSRQQINKIAKELNDEMKKIDGDTLTARQLQDLKISAQQASKYEPGTVRETGTEQASKAVAKAAKEGVEELVPDAAAINKELAELKKLKKPLMQAASRIENRDLISIGTPLKTMAGGEMAGGRGAIVGAIAGMAEAKKAQMALGLKAMQDAGLGNLINQDLMRTLIKQGLYQTGRLQPEDENVR